MEIDVRYLAGFFDGEGCIQLVNRVTKEGKQRSNMSVVITQANLDILHDIELRYKGSIYELKKTPNKCWQLVLSASNALEFLQDVVPYLIIKKEQALLAIEFQEHLSSNKSRAKVSIEDLLYRSNLATKVKSLKI